MNKKQRLKAKELQSEIRKTINKFIKENQFLYGNRTYDIIVNTKDVELDLSDGSKVITGTESKVIFKVRKIT